MKIRKLKPSKSIVIRGEGDIPDSVSRKKINELIDRIEQLEDRLLTIEIKYR